MSLYHESSQILSHMHSNPTSGSLKSHIFRTSTSSPSSSKRYKSDAKQLYALTTETAKFSAILSEVITNSGILTVEKVLAGNLFLALVLVYDFLLGKKGIVLPGSHGLVTAVGRHRARLVGEFTRARVRRGVGDVVALRVLVNGERGKGGGRYPRWVRVNALRSSVEQELRGTFEGYERVGSVREVLEGEDGKLLVCLDEHVPGLLAVSAHVDLTRTEAYKTGRIILQDKASCFPAYLLDPTDEEGDVIDACAAPGNKTTHLAAILGRENTSKIIACEKDALRSQTLSKMVKTAGGESIITVKQKQDFMKLKPEAYANVTSLLLDPSCSGSGIVGRDEERVVIHLPKSAPETVSKSKKRKREPEKITPQVDTAADEEVPIATDDAEKLQARLEALSSFQLRLLERAMSFPSAKKITYSTCSVHVQENEGVVVRALTSEVGRTRGWRVLKREEQVEGMKKWHVRGWKGACHELVQELDVQEIVDAETVAEACIRCEKGSEDGTMGFFVAAFIRDDGISTPNGHTHTHSPDDQDEEEEEWTGFGD